MRIQKELLQCLFSKKYFIFFFGICAFFLALPSLAHASHSWGNYHWARTNNPFALKLGDNVSSVWDSYLGTTAFDWDQSSVLNASIVGGGTTSRRCRPTAGRDEVCNYKYGNNGWLGVAQIWISGSHITQGTVKVNDTYFNTTKYNTSAWKSLVMCQEVGHTLGLDHQDENFNNGDLGTCMDYSSDPTLNQHPNQHDYDQLEVIYSHLDSVTSVGQKLRKSANGEFHDRSEWGQELKNNGKVALYVRDLGGGIKLFTHVIWALDYDPQIKPITIPTIKVPQINLP